MKVIVQILRRDGRYHEPYRQSFEIDPPLAATVSWALGELNARLPLVDIDGKTARHIAWNCGCGQKTCGVCAMVINGRPMLACAAFIEDLAVRKLGKSIVSVEPLSKFPVVRDLVVDTTMLEEKMLEAGAFLSGASGIERADQGRLMEISQCMLCGCCFEVCPNCLQNSPFIGPAAMHGALRAALQEPAASHRKRILRNARDKGGRLCSRALSCQAVCPAGIPVTGTLASL